jgi:molecular chaperone GrpE (heat shock protein)
MANTYETRSTEAHESNGNTEGERLTARVQELETECTKLQQALAQAQAECNLYRQTMYAYARAAREFENADMATLHATSAGPVEMIE